MEAEREKKIMFDNRKKKSIFHAKKVSEGSRGHHTDNNKAELRRPAYKDQRKDPNPK